MLYLLISLVNLLSIAVNFGMLGWDMPLKAKLGFYILLIVKFVMTNQTYVIVVISPNKEGYLLSLVLLFQLTALILCMLTFGGHVKFPLSMVISIFLLWWMITAGLLGYT